MEEKFRNGRLELKQREKRRNGRISEKLRKRRIVKSFKKKEKQLIHKINACNKVRLYGIGIYTP